MFVIEIAEGAAGPFCGKLLAELGADVLKLEPPGGERARWEGPFPGGIAHPERSAAFLFRNTGKRSRVVDLGTPAGRALLSELAAKADVLIAGLSPAEERALGLDLDGLRAANPRLIVTHITPFGRSGPLADLPGDERTVQALSGFMDLHGAPDRPPVTAPGAQAGHIAGLAAAVATLAAARDAQRGGTGRVIDVAAAEAMLALIFGPVMAYSYQRATRTRMGNRSATYGPLTDVYPCTDGFITIAIETSRQWETLCGLLGRPDLLETIPWGTAREHGDDLWQIIAAWTRARSRIDAFTTMQEYRLPVGQILTPAEVLADPQCAARGFFVELGHPAAGPLRYPGSPFDRGSGTTAETLEPLWQPTRPAPLLDESRPSLMPLLPAPSCADPRHPTSGSQLPLAGLRILDLTMVWAGPFGASLLADLGAEVIKIEAVQRPDMVRWGQPADNRPRESAFNAGGSFHSLNRNKLGLTLNLATPDGREAFLHLVARSDGVIENYSRRVMGNFGLGYDALCAVNPRLVMVSMPGYGATGPYRDYVSFGEVLEGMAGIAALAGYGDGLPLRHGIAYLDPVGGYCGALAMIAGIIERERTGAGRHISLAQRDAGIRLIGDLILAAQMEQPSAPVPGLGVGGVYRALGHPEWVAVSVPSQEAGAALCALLDHADLTSHLTTSTEVPPASVGERLRAALASWMATRTAHDAARQICATGCVAVPVNAVDTLFEDPHLTARGFFVVCDHPEVGRRLLMGAPFLLDGQRPPVRLPAPNFGQHNERLLGALPGFDAKRLAYMAAAKIIGTWPE